MNFKTFHRLISEGFVFDGNMLKIDHTKPIQDIFISLGLGYTKAHKPYITHHKSIPNVELVSAYQIDKKKVDRNTLMEVLLTLKGQGKHKISPSDLDKLLSRSAEYLWKYLQSKKISTITYPQSSSALASQFADKFQGRVSDTVLIPSAFKKSDPKMIRLDYESMALYKLSPKTIKALEDIIEKAKAKGSFKIHDVPTMLRKFFNHFMEPSHINMLDKVEGKNILLVDDILTSGSTTHEIVRIINKFQPNKIYVATLFRMKGGLSL